MVLTGCMVSCGLSQYKYKAFSAHGGLVTSLLKECHTGSGTSMKNGYSIVILRIEKDPFSKGIFNNFIPFLSENKVKS